MFKEKTICINDYQIFYLFLRLISNICLMEKTLSVFFFMLFVNNKYFRQKTRMLLLNWDLVCFILFYFKTGQIG